MERTIREQWAQRVLNANEDPPEGENLADLWLRPLGAGGEQGLHWWTRDSFGQLTGGSLVRQPLAREDVAEQARRCDLRAVLRADVARVLADALARHGRLRLHLPTAFGDVAGIPLESLHHQGQALFGRLLPVRGADLGADPAIAIRPARVTVVANLLGREHPLAEMPEVQAGPVRIIDGATGLAHYLRQSDPLSAAALIVIAHGREDHSLPPLLTAEGRPWTLPLAQGLPPLVMVLACDGSGARFAAEVSHWQAAGAMALVLPQGRLCPRAAGGFLAAFAARWCAGERLDALLLDLQANPASARGARMVRLHGRGDLRVTAELDPQCADDETLADRAGDQDAALICLLDRLSQRMLARGQPLDAAEEPLRALLGVRWLARTSEHWLLQRLNAVERHCWPLTRAWLLPLQARLAEAWDHRQFAALLSRREAPQARNPPLSPRVWCAWSKLAYRQGHYALATEDLSRGLAGLADVDGREAVELVGALIAILIDLNLPRPAVRLGQWLDDRLDTAAGAAVALARHIWHDRRARLALRQGDPERALMRYRRKAHEAADFGGTGQRELAWQLYIEAWRAPDAPGARALAGQARAALAECLEPPSQGNDDQLYLLRALAAWTWRTCDPRASQAVLSALPLLIERLERCDCGPAGYALAYLHLARGRGLAVAPGVNGLLPGWSAVMEALAQDRYYQEIAVFEHLAGHAEAARRALACFQRQRRLLAPPTAPMLVAAACADWPVQLREREATESGLLHASEIVRPKQLLATGCLPL